MTEKPPVPITKILPCPECGEKGESDMGEDCLICPFCSHSWDVTLEQLWLAGYQAHAAQHDSAIAQAGIRLGEAAKRIAELEAEVAELRESLLHSREDVKRLCRHLGAEDGEPPDLSRPIPRRTPELTERVVELLRITPYYEDPRGLAEKLFVLVFGKKD